MAIRNIESIRRMIARLRSDPHFKAMIARNNFATAASTAMVLDLNSRSQNDRHHYAAQWCEAEARGKWRRLIVERVRHARLDRVYFDFEYETDQKAFDDWLAAQGW
ncbi:hypothetical protein [Methylobacterium sp. WL64]|uniref:hypothetical protein n=1 Tax=Methylobacterium sp. WL64 TaxID=2603894 RepID=UPI001650B2A4|nr:hypothetical protein [Methylobacterium sp. WL64]